MKSHETIGGVVLLLFGLATVILSLRMPIGTFRTAGTGLFPFALGILLMGLSFAYLAGLRFGIKKPDENKVPALETVSTTRQMIFVLGTMASAALFFNSFGYPLTSFLLLMVLLRILGMKRWTFNISLSVVTAAVSYLLFVRWLKIPLPKGFLGL